VKTSQAVQGGRCQRMRQMQRVFLPVSTVASHSAGPGDDRAPACHGPGCILTKPQSTIHKRLSTCSPVDVFAICTVESLCRSCSVLTGLHAMTQLDAQSVSDLRAHSRAARSARLENLLHQVVAIEFPTSFCAVEKAS
jgi:hypothetical protein